jgi:DNA-binding CsgD family transcriptional regulator
MRKAWDYQNKYDVLVLLAQGLPRKRIAECLGVSDRLVKWHVEQWYRKAGLFGHADSLRIGAWAREQLSSKAVQKDLLKRASRLIGEAIPKLELAIGLITSAIQYEEVLKELR